MASNVNFSNKQIFLNKNQPLDQKIIIENLNYIEFWSFKELKEYFIDYFENHYK